MPSKVISGSTKVVDFGTNRKRVFDFLLVINSNLCRISHRLGDHLFLFTYAKIEYVSVQTYLSENRIRTLRILEPWWTNEAKIAIFNYPTLIWRPLSLSIRLIGRKSPIRTHPTLIQRPRSGWPPSNFGMNVLSPETRMMGLPYGEEIMIVGQTMWTQSTSVTDRRTELLSQRPCNAERRTVKNRRRYVDGMVYGMYTAADVTEN